MLFLGWLAVCFLAVGAINLYLRHFGLPRRKIRGGDAARGSAGYGASISFSGSGASFGGLLHGTGSSGSVGGESGRWINSVLSWIYQTQNRVPEFVESWINALTTEAQRESNEMQIRFEGIHGSPPEFSNFRTESSSTDKNFTILSTLTLKDVTLQTSTLGKSVATKATQPVKCDVYLQNLTGQVKVVAQMTPNDPSLQLSFISEPTIKLQLRPTRIDYAIDNAAFERVVRAALSRAAMRVDWKPQSSSSSSSGSRPSHLRIVEPASVERTPAHRSLSDNQVQQSRGAPEPRVAFSDTRGGGVGLVPIIKPSVPTSAQNVQTPQSPQTGPLLDQKPIQGHYQEQGQQYPGTVQGQQHVGTVQAQQYPGTVQGQQYPGAVQGQQYPGTVQGQQYPGTVQGQQYPGTVQGQQHPGAVQGQQYPGTVQGQPYPGTVQGQHSPGIIQGQHSPGIVQGRQYPQYSSTDQGQGMAYQTSLQTSVSSEMFVDGPKLFIKVVKANGLIDTDFGNCSAFCRVHIDTPPQDFVTNVMRNTVNPYWDEQFISDFDRRTKQIQFEVLDRDRQSDNDLLGKAIVLVEEIRRMPSSRQIIPLTGKPKSRTSTSGSITVEFIFRDSVSPSTSSSSTSAVPLGLGQGPAGHRQSTTTPPTLLSPVAGDDKNRLTSSSSPASYSPYSVRSASAMASGTAAAAAATAGGGGGGGASQLSAHNLALTSVPTVGTRTQESPSVVITGVDSQRSATLQPTRSIFGTKDSATSADGKKPRESLASTLKRTLGRVKIKPRSQSADRSTSHSLREGNLLKPPGQSLGPPDPTQSAAQQSNRNTVSASDASTAATSSGVAGSDGTLRKGRSNSFSSSLRRIFRREKKDAGREGSLNKPPSTSSSATHLGRGNGSREALTAPQHDFDRSRRQNTPVPSGDRFPSSTEFPYSSSVPAPSSPLQSR